MITKGPRSNLPPGFRFHPTDEELILHYLRKKVQSSPVPVSIIADVDIYKFDPWNLPAKAPFGEKEWYFFSPRDRKYPNGARPNRAAASGYWKATGTDKVITTTVGGGFQESIGVKKALVFYEGRPPKGVKTNWIMHEYRLTESPNPNRINRNVSNQIDGRGLKSKDSSMRLDDWVLCRIYNKPHASSSSPAMTATTSDQEQEQEQEQELVITQKTLLPKLENTDALKSQKSCSFSNLLDTVDLSFFSSFLSENPGNHTESESPSLIGSINPDYTLFTGYGINNNDDYLDQKLPQLSSLPEERVGSDTKRQRSGFDEEIMNPSKKMMSTYNCKNTIDQSDHSMIHQYGFLNHQQFLSSYLQFHR